MLQARIDPDIKTKLTEQASAENLPEAEIVRRALEQYFEKLYCEHCVSEPEETLAWSARAVVRNKRGDVYLRHTLPKDGWATPPNAYVPLTEREAELMIAKMSTLSR